MGPLIPPYAHHLNHGMQTVATVVLWAGTVALLVWAARLARQERSPIPVVLVLAVAAGSLIEPLYDTSYHLLWYVPGQWTLFTAFGLPQPVWVMPAYVMVFAFPALVLYRWIGRGAGTAVVFKFAALLAATTAVFEITAINVNLYGYYGDAPMRVLHYPLWIAVMEAAQIAGYGVLAAALKRWATRPAHSLALFLLFPANFAFVTLGAGFPTLMAINAPDPSPAVMWVCGLLSMALAAGALWLTTQLLGAAGAPARDVAAAGSAAVAAAGGARARDGRVPSPA
jgi:hypothetical protein